TQHRVLSPSASTTSEWVTYSEAQTQYGFARSTLNRWVTEGCPYLSGGRLGFCQRSEGVGNRVIERRQFRRAELEAIAAARRQADHTARHDDADGRWWPIGEAARQSGIPSQQWEYWRDVGSPVLGRKLRAKRIRRTGRKTPNGLLWVIHDDDFRQILAG